MATIPYLTGNNSKIFTALKMYNRSNALPLDPTSVFETKAQVEAYIAETGSYAYAGQIVAVANGTLADGTPDYSVYVIRSDKTLQDITSTRAFDSVEAAQTFVTANTAVNPGELITVKNGTKYELYTVGTDKVIGRVSFDTADVPDVSWSNLQDKPTSTTTQIDAAVATAEKFTVADGTLSYDGTALAKAGDLTWDSIANKPSFGTSAGNFAEGDHTHAKETITSVSASVIDGIIPLANLPQGALERCVVVADDTARLALTTDDIQQGDTVKVTATGKMYFVADETKLNEEDGYIVYTAGSATEVPWSGVTGKPTTLSGYGITDAVNSSDVVDTAAANKILKLDSDGKLPASITGDADTLDGKHASDFIAAGTTFGNDDLTGIDWSKVDNTPTTLSGYGITDAIGSSDVVTTAAANKILKLDENGKLPTDITGDAATLEGHAASYFMTADASVVKTEDVVTSAAANKILKLDENGKLPASITGDADTLDGKHASDFIAAGTTFGNDDLTGIDWSKVSDTPTTLSGYGITDAIGSSDIVTTATADKVLKLNSDAKLPASITGDADTVDGKHASDFMASDAVVPKAQVGGVAADKIDGIIPIANLPHGALERCVVVADDTARLALTTDDIQQGDTVKVTATGKMYFVVDETKLNEAAGYEVYTAGSATEVPWSGVTGKPSFGTGEGDFAEGNHTHTAADVGAVDLDDVVNVGAAGSAGKILALDASGKVDAEVYWSKIDGKPTSTAADIDAAVTAATHTNRATLDKLAENNDGGLTHNSNALAYKSDLFNIVVSADEPSDLAVGSMWFEVVSEETVQTQSPE